MYETWEGGHPSGTATGCSNPTVFGSIVRRESSWVAYEGLTARGMIRAGTAWVLLGCAELALSEQYLVGHCQVNK